MLNHAILTFTHTHTHLRYSMQLEINQISYTFITQFPYKNPPFMTGK
jgi:hypothetical protein